MVKLKMKSLSPSKSPPSQRKAGRKVKAEGNRKVKPEEDLLLPIDQTKKADVKSRQIRVLIEDDICDVFGLPNGGHDLELLVTSLASYSSSDGESLKSLWRERYKIISNKDPIPLSAYVLEELVIGVREAVRGAKYDWGCIVLLAISYFHRYIKRVSKLSNEMPLIQHWNDQKFGDRLKHEEVAGGLGHSDRSEVVFPVSRKHSNKSGEPSSLPNKPVCNVRHIVVDLPADIRTDEEVHSSSIDDVHEVLLLNERDSELFCKRYMNRMNLIKLKMQARSEQSSLKDSSQVSPSAASQETGTVDGVGTEQLVATPSFFTSQVIKKVDEYVNVILTMRESRGPFGSALAAPNVQLPQQPFQTTYNHPQNQSPFFPQQIDNHELDMQSIIFQITRMKKESQERDIVLHDIVVHRSMLAIKLAQLKAKQDLDE
ncbi:hypothetical protein KSS87_007696 [Heliosperma pusillum]|nr:hypothetical protein KSS87_007696 [Heliosperma pusillum]